jgi:hypothetical protein
MVRQNPHNKQAVQMNTQEQIIHHNRVMNKETKLTLNIKFRQLLQQIVRQ